MKLEAFRVPRLKKNFLQWIRYTKYMICVARKKDMISSRCFLISKMLFFEAGAQIHNVDELDGLCDIASDMIQSSIKERLIATFAAWRERFSYWRRRMMLAQLRERDLYVKRRFRKWKQQAVGCLNRIKTVAKKSDDILLERMFERWKAR
ncbi:hypothetical protein BC830DRAFT_98426 [Chytriomyces sp. MP71]|nr:hypothetical protein BC830DRAFT_98426 [Chytriomyces sp. MP71]